MTLRFPEPSTLWLGGSIVLGICGLIAAGIGVGTGIDYLFASSHPIGVTDAFLLRIEYTMAGIFLLISSIAVARIASKTDAVTD